MFLAEALNRRTGAEKGKEKDMGRFARGRRNRLRQLRRVKKKIQRARRKTKTKRNVSRGGAKGAEKGKGKDMGRFARGRRGENTKSAEQALNINTDLVNPPG